jgi:putative alpha-1,2-mannosidase
MTLRIPMLFALLACAACPSALAASGHAGSVDPRIGTGGDGHTFPGATVPFGMIQLSPDTAMPDFKHAYKWAAGYQYGDSSIMGFSHTHFSGSGHSDLGDVLVMPIAGDVRLEPGDPATPGSGYRSRFSHDSEVVQAGYYAVTLSDYGIRAELTAGRRVGWHRYTFPKGKPAHLLLDLRPSIYDYPGKVLWSKLQVADDGTVTGCRTTRGWAPGRELCFAMRFSQPMTSRALYDRESDVLYKGFKVPGNQQVDHDAKNVRAVVGLFDFGALKQPLEV